jgi:hypothetical protein
MQEVLHRYDYLSEQHKKECEDHDREREYNRTVQRAKKDLENKIRQMQLFMVHLIQFSDKLN